MAKDIAIELSELHAAQKTMLAESRRFNVACLGRRSGKTFLGCDILLDGPRGKGALHGYPVAWYSPTFTLLLESWRKVVAICKPITAHKSEQHKRLELITGGVIEMWSLDDPDAGRGRKYAVAVVDEAAMIRRLDEAIEQNIKPLLMDYQGELWLLSTPKGISGPGATFKQMFEKGNPRNPDRDEQWMSWQMPTTCNPYIDPAEIEVMRAELPELVFAQEILAEFVDMGGTVVKREWLRHGQPPKGMKLYMGVDLAISTREDADFTAVVTVGVDDSGRVWIVEAERRRVGFHDALAFIKQKAARWLPVDIAIEAVQYQAAAVEELLRSTDLPVRKIKPDKDKLTRFQRLQPRYQQGLVWHADDLPMYFEEELLSFPVGEHDDLVDATVYGYAMTGDYGKTKMILPEWADTAPGWASTTGVPPAVLQALEPLPQGAVCGRCTAYRDGYCGERFNVRVREGDLGCDLFVGRDGNLST